MKLEFPGFDQFEPTAPLMHAYHTLQRRIPAGCDSITLEFDEQGAALVMANGSDEGLVDVTLSANEMSAAGLLLSYLSHQVIQLTEMCQEFGGNEVYAAQRRLATSLGQHGLSIGLLEEPVCEGEDIDFADTLTVYRQPR